MMGFFKKKAEEKTSHIKKIETDDKEFEDVTLEKNIDADIGYTKRDLYIVPGVDEVDIPRSKVRQEFLTRPTNYRCTKCKSILYNTKLDGRHYYCPICNVQWDKDDL